MWWVVYMCQLVSQERVGKSGILCCLQYFHVLLLLLLWFLYLTHCLIVEMGVKISQLSAARWYAPVPSSDCPFDYYY